MVGFIVRMFGLMVRVSEFEILLVLKKMFLEQNIMSEVLCDVSFCSFLVRIFG